MSHINFICEIAHAYQHMPAYFHYITQNHAYLPTHTRTWVPMMAQWPPLMRGHPFWEATFTQHLGWLLVRGFTVITTIWSMISRFYPLLFHFEVKCSFFHISVFNSKTVNPISFFLFARWLVEWLSKNHNSNFRCFQYFSRYSTF